MFQKRTVEQVLVHGLILNTMGAAENAALAAIATSEEALTEFYADQLMDEVERVNGWDYAFKVGPLRYFNPSGTQHRSEHVFGHGVFSEWVQEGEIDSEVFRVDF